MPSILSLIADEQLNNVRNRNRVYDENASYLYPVQTIVYPDIIQSDNDDLSTIADFRLEETKNLNLNIPENGYEKIDLSNIDGNIIDAFEIEDILPERYDYFNTMNNYVNIDSSYIRNIDDPSPVENKIDSYLEFMSPIVSRYNRSIPSFLDYIDNIVKNDSPIGEIAKDQILNVVTKNFEDNLFQQTVGRLNTDVFGLIQGESFIREDFSITKPRTLVGEGVNIAQKLLGLQLPFCNIPPEAFSIYVDETIDVKERTNLLLEFTGRAYKKLIINNFNKNKYNPDLENESGTKFYYVDKSKNAFNGLKIVFGGQDVFRDYHESYGYGYYKNNESYNPNVIGVYNKNIENIDENDSEWSNSVNNFYNENSFDEDSLLYKTKQLFSLRSNDVFIDQYSKFFINQSSFNGEHVSRGSSITSFGSFTTDDGVEVGENDFFRVFTKGRKYNKLAATLRHRALDVNPSQSVLGDNGIPIYAPTINERNNRIFKKYMFSISNFAWKGNVANIPICERYVSPDGSVARQMWFAPYDLKISETISPNITTTEFFGRNEPIYTLSNTKRSLQLSFALLVDHPAIVNNARGQYNHIWERYFKGDKSIEPIIQNLIDNRLSPVDQAKIDDLKRTYKSKPWTVDDPVKTGDDRPDNYGVLLSSHYFPNDYTDIIINDLSLITLNGGYENGDGLGLGFTYVNGIKKETKEYTDRTDNSLNVSYFNNFNNQLNNGILDLLREGEKNIIVNVVGYASAALGNRLSNTELADKRAVNLLQKVQSVLTEFSLYQTIEANEATISFNVYNEGDSNDAVTNENSFADDYASKIARKAEVYLSTTTNENYATVDELLGTDAYTDFLPVSVNAIIDSIDDSINDLLFTDKCYFFKQLEINDPFLYNTISEKIDYFSPAFHSYTPQNFNERLTFLQQCTRSANNIGLDGEEPTNLFYGYQPFIYISIGDFFKSKAIISSLSIDYNAYDLMWDTNPESGVGVQPMLAGVTMTLEIIGGQSMTGALNRLQNALSFNYYANTENYDYRADKQFSYVEDGEIKTKIIDGLKRSELFDIKEVETKRENLKIAYDQGIFTQGNVANNLSAIGNTDSSDLFTTLNQL